MTSPWLTIIIPVSYTHLDVNKRQALMHSFGYKVHNLYNLNYSINTLAWCDILFSAETVI